MNKNKKSEKGASLIIALVFIAVLLVIITMSLKASRSTAHNIYQVSTAKSEKWAARTLTARAGAWVISELPLLYKSEIITAIRNCNNKNLPAFNSVSNPSAAPCEESYLGNIETWLASKESAAVAFATQDSPNAQVTVKISEIYRSGSGAAVAYHIGYSAAAGNGETYGTDQNQNEIVLGSSENCSCELRLAASANSVAAGSPVILTAEFWNIEKIELYENNVLVESSLVQNLKNRQLKTWTRVINTDTEFFVKGSVAANSCHSYSNKAIIATSVINPTPTPTPTETPTPTPTPTPSFTRSTNVGPGTFPVYTNNGLGGGYQTQAYQLQITSIDAAGNFTLKVTAYTATYADFTRAVSYSPAPDIPIKVVDNSDPCFTSGGAVRDLSYGYNGAPVFGCPLTANIALTFVGIENTTMPLGGLSAPVTKVYTGIAANGVPYLSFAYTSSYPLTSGRVIYAQN